MFMSIAFDAFYIVFFQEMTTAASPTFTGYDVASESDSTLDWPSFVT